jgi:tRNA (guanosine-2'-O-)-methyltransferase
MNYDESTVDAATSKSRKRQRADVIKQYRCKNLIAVIEDPHDIRNIGTVIRNVCALGVEKTYIVDPRRTLPHEWREMREQNSLSKTSASAVKWSFVKRFDSSEECLQHLEKKNFVSAVTSPHVKGHNNVVLHEGDYTVHHKLAVWFGNESRGVSALVVKRSKMCINIPMLGMIESLNLGTTSGIVLYEITKQRRAYQRMYKYRGKRGRKFIA